MTDRILRPREVCRAIGLSRTTLWRRVRDGQFPKPLRQGPNAVGWRASAIDEWLDSREAA
ncbi:MAG: AlpA family transcriptional regulator [Gammaproteobacteria bacterium]|nr:AlpA family transcriptional regulator [Gammaproteobacteria bacterium]